MVRQWLRWLCAYFHRGLYATSNSSFRNITSRICFNWLWKDELSQSNGPTALFPAQCEVTKGRNYLSGGCLEPCEGHGHTYPLTAGLNTLSNTHSKRERQQEAEIERKQRKEEKENSKVCWKKRQIINFATISSSSVPARRTCRNILKAISEYSHRTQHFPHKIQINIQKSRRFNTP